VVQARRQNKRGKGIMQDDASKTGLGLGWHYRSDIPFMTSEKDCDQLESDDEYYLLTNSRVTMNNE
jgi:hypothetical protein